LGHFTRRSFTLAGLSVALLAVLLTLGALNAFNIRALQPGSTGALLVFTAVTVLIFLLLLALLVLLARNILKLYADGRSRVLGSRLRSRMIVGALLLSFAPTLFMFLFSYLLMNRSIDRWFSQPVVRIRDDSTRIALELSHYVTQNARAEAESLVHSGAFSVGYEAGDPSALANVMRSRRITLEGGFVAVYRDDDPLATYQLPANAGPAGVHVWLEPQEPPTPPALGQASAARAATATSAPPKAGNSDASRDPSRDAALCKTILATARRSDEPILTIGGNEYALGSAPISNDGIVVVALPMPSGLSSVVDDIGSGARQYWSVYRQRRTIRSTYLLLLLLLTTLTFFASSWLALFLSKQITRPVEALADAMDEIAAGDYRQRISFSATEELGDLIASFNQMAADLEHSRAVAQTSTEQLSAANRAIDERRHELELILETIPSGVVVLDTGRRILQVNRAFLDLCVPAGIKHAHEFGTDRPSSGDPTASSIDDERDGEHLAGMQLEDALPPELRDEILRLERRAQRMGVAGAELEMRSPGGPNAIHSSNGHAWNGNGSGANGNGTHTNTPAMLSLSVTIAVLNLGRDRLGHDRRGSILVVDDVSDVLQAQRQVAWKEVAQRVAHEIKNPLTPISLSAERIRRHVDRLGAQAPPESAAVIRRCSEVILGSVESMRTLVDQFAALAEFPAAQPRPASINEIVESALSLFHGRLQSIRIESRLNPGLPPVMADPEALKRAIANLIDNAAEAMSDSLLRVLTLETQLGERPGMAELAISDTGSGLSPEVRERIFLPYVSTKQRGTGLGLVIAAKIIQDHQGTIRAEQRTPSGARFVLELPLADGGRPGDSTEDPAGASIEETTLEHPETAPL
jgi:nitrogen fixation/metabolism regulation signal transduction histidine kinase